MRKIFACRTEEQFQLLLDNYRYTPNFSSNILDGIKATLRHPEGCYVVISIYDDVIMRQWYRVTKNARVNGAIELAGCKTIDEALLMHALRS